jgi:alkylated DNA repair dioxygenase AlkB
MNTLFSIEPTYPEGFSYQENFITPEEENELCKQIETIELHPFDFQGYKANRRVASFGYDYSFDNRTLQKGKEIPTAFQPLISRVSSHLAIPAENFSELLITEYPERSVINWHRDAPPFDIIAGISLLADCTFRLRPQEKSKQVRAAVISIPVARRSLYVIRGAARTDWQHSITPVKQSRYSITLRTLRPQQ